MFVMFLASDGRAPTSVTQIYYWLTGALRVTSFVYDPRDRTGIGEKPIDSKYNQVRNRYVEWRSNTRKKVISNFAATMNASHVSMYRFLHTGRQILTYLPSWSLVISSFNKISDLH